MKRRFDKAQDRVAPKRQNNWDWRAAANFMCGGAGAGLLVWAAVARLAGGAHLQAPLVLALVLVGTGLTCVWFEIGRPLRALNTFRHLSSSWMAREAAVAAMLFPVGARAVLGSGLAWTLLAGLCGLAFLFCQARILLANKGIPAWRHARSFPLMLGTGLSEGLALLILCAPVQTRAAPGVLALALLILVLGRLVLWKRYLDGLAGGSVPIKSLAALREVDLRMVILGHALPAAGAIVALGGASPAYLMLGAALAVACGAWLKFVLVRRAAFTQGFAIPDLPVRGRGKIDGGARPGWA